MAHLIRRTTSAVSYYPLLFTFIACFVLVVNEGTAQETATVQGVVLDETGASLPGANVRIDGTGRGVSTDMDGAYELSGITAGEVTLVASFVGYQAARETITLEAGETRTVDFSLIPGAVDLDEMVVTALGIDRQRRSLGYAVERVAGSDIADSDEVNVLDGLAGRVAGLDVVGGSAGLASSPRVIIRGEASLAGQNRPLIVVDGVPIDNTPNTQFSDAQTTQVDFGDGLDQINPEDIREMSVLKGPSAAALYGSRAANGVILIETKDGSGAEGLGVSLKTSLTGSRPLRLPDYQNEYSYGNGGEFFFIDGTNAPGWNWGVRMDDGVERPQFGNPRDANGILMASPVSSVPGKVEDFFGTGTNVTTNLSVRGANERGSFRASMSRSDRTGIVPNTNLDRTNFSLSSRYRLSDALQVAANATFSKTTSDNLPASGYGSESIMYYFTWGARNVGLDLLRDYWVEGEEGRQQSHYDLNWTNNPFFQVNENTSSLNRDRLYGGFTATVEVTDRLDIQARAGLDYSDQSTKQRKAFSSVTAPDGWLQETERRFFEWNTDLLASYSFSLGDGIVVEPSVGTSYRRQTRRNLQLTAEALSLPGIYNIGNARSDVRAEEFDQAQEIGSVYGTATVNYRDLAYLDVTGRNDWSSTLPVGNNSFFYPSVSLSLIASDILSVPQGAPLSFAKVRLSWAQVGNDTEPFRLRNTFSFGQAWGSTQAVSSASDLNNPELRPEITSSYEAGVDLGFFERRARLDATYYRSTSRDQILRIPLARSTGFNSRLINAGEIRNTGVELTAGFTPIRDLGGLRWDVNVNWARNRSTVVELADGVENFVLGQGPFGGSAEARVGGRMGDLYGRVFQRVEDPASPHFGEIIYENGLPQLTDDIRRIGNYNHDWQGGLGTRLSFRNLELSGLLDIRQGGRIYSNTHATGIEGGTLVGTTCCRNETVVGEGVVQNGDGTFAENTQEAPYVTWLRTYYARSNVETNSFDASYIKLRALTLRYTYTPSWLQEAGVQRARISLSGRNLFLWTSVPHIDPETTITSGEQRVPGFEVQQLPSTRSFGFTLEMDF